VPPAGRLRVPDTPQTHIVEALGALVKKGELNAGFLNVESEFAAMSAVIGASVTGARTPIPPPPARGCST
jgi:pyruvate/2-oxoacid:ferredoxin oxidoreductase alpha subunit